LKGLEMEFVYNDGGRAAAGFKGNTGDCVTRAIAIATGKPYQEVYDALNELAKLERRGKRKKGISNARTGVYKNTRKRYLESLGWRWVSCMAIGSGCQVHLVASELPPGRLVVGLSRHSAAVIDGVLHDTYDHSGKRVEIGSRDGVPYRKEWFRCVYGYFYKPE
jgi:hypothetical protein